MPGSYATLKLFIAFLRVDFDAKKGALETAFDSERRRFELKISDLENVKEELSQKKVIPKRLQNY